MNFVSKTIDPGCPDDTFAPSKYKINCQLKNQHDEIEEFIKVNAEALVKKSCISLVADDWQTSTGSFGLENEYRAVMLVVRAPDGSVLEYVISFRIVKGKKHDDIADDVKNTLKRYALEKAFTDGLIPVVIDGGLISAFQKITGSAVTCSAHSITQISKRLF